MRFVSVHVVHPYCSIASDMVRKKSYFLLSNTSDFHMIDNLSIVVYTLAIRLLTSISVDEILQPKYENWFANSRALKYKVEMALSC